MKKTLPLLILLLALFSACASDQNSYDPIPTNRATESSEITVYVSELIYGNYIYDAQRLSGNFAGPESKSLKRLNQIVADLGFTIQFESIPVQNEAAQNYKYIDTCIENLDKLDQENTMMVLSTQLTEFDKFRELVENSPKYLDIDADTWAEYAPNWYAQVKDYISEHPKQLPLGDYVSTQEQPALVVREDLNQKYDDPIHTLSDLEVFMRWVQQTEPDKVPLTFVYYPMERFNYYYQFVDHIILSLTREALDGALADFYLANQIGLVASEKDGQIAFSSVEDDSGFRDVIHQLVRWREEGLMEFHEIESDFKYPWDRSASILMGLKNWRYDSTEMRFADQYKQSLTDRMKQVPHLLFSGQLSKMERSTVEWYSSVAIMGENMTDAAVREWLSFVEWLHADMANARQITWGIEGEDYQIANDCIELIDTSDDVSPELYYRWMDILQFFHDRNDNDIYSKIKTPGLQQLVDDQTYPEDDTATRRLKELTLKGLNETLRYAYQDQITMRQKAVYQMLESVILLPSERVDSYLDEFSASQKEQRDELIKLYEAFLNT